MDLWFITFHCLERMMTQNGRVSSILICFHQSKTTNRSKREKWFKIDNIIKSHTVLSHHALETVECDESYCYERGDHIWSSGCGEFFYHESYCDERVGMTIYGFQICCDVSSGGCIQNAHGSTLTSPWPDPKGHVRYYHHFASSVVC
jgi:hypothetical protein